MVKPSGTTYVAGWGRTENTSSSDVLLKAKSPMMRAGECKLKFPSFNFISDDNSQICAVEVKGKCRNKNISINTGKIF